MQTYNFDVSQATLTQIQSGKKDLEVRTSWNYHKDFRVGDVISFNHFILCRVVDIRRYNDFNEMLKSENPERVLPGSTSEQVLASLRELYTSRYEELGVVVFEIKVVT